MTDRIKKTDLRADEVAITGPIQDGSNREGPPDEAADVWSGMSQSEESALWLDFPSVEPTDEEDPPFEDEDWDGENAG